MNSWLVKMEDTLSLWIENMTRKHTPIDVSVWERTVSDPLKCVTPRHLLSMRNGYTDFGMHLD